MAKKKYGGSGRSRSRRGAGRMFAGKRGSTRRQAKGQQTIRLVVETVAAAPASSLQSGVMAAEPNARKKSMF